MRVLITGGTGFIGSRLALELHDRGDQVLAVGLTQTAAEAANIEILRLHGIRVEVAALDELRRWCEMLEGVDVVYHLAAVQHEMNVPDARFEAVNVAITRKLLEEALRIGIGRLVHASTIGVYGKQSGTLALDTPTAPDNVYGHTKLKGEEMVMSFADRLPVSVIRVPETYGPADRRLLKLFKTIKKKRFFMIGDGHNRHHPIHVEDLIRALLTTAEHPNAAGRIFLVAGPKPLTSNEMVADIAAAVDLPAPALRAPMAPFMATAYGMETVLRPIGIQPPLHRRRMGFFTKDQVIDDSVARADLGFTPAIGFREGAAHTAEWYRQHNLL